METLEQKIRITFIKNGLWLGLILIGLSMLSFYFITVINTSPVLFVASPLIFAFIIPILVVLAFCFSGRKNIGGYWTFKQATAGIFIMFLIAYLLQTIGRDFVFARLIEPQMIEKTEKAFLSTAAIIRKQPGANQKALDKNEAEVKKNFEEQKHVTFGQVIQGMVFSILFIFVLALIFGALFKRDVPVYISRPE
jgi:hypothetical protein